MGAVRANGYIQIAIDYKIYLAHRLAWFYMNGDWPSGEIDHINRERSDNRLTNLRLADRSQQLCNASKRTDNKSGQRGVFWVKRDSRWQATIVKDGRQTYLGQYKDKADAIAAYERAAADLHGAFRPID